MNVADWAEDTARTILEVPLPRRWAHTQSVAAQARGLAAILGHDADIVTAAAWLHDVGYAPDLHDTGFHPLDGARYLRSTGQIPDVVCRLVAHHSCAAIEAAEHGLAAELARDFAPACRDLTDALIFCDMTTGPDGRRLSIEQRLSEIHARYGSDHLVSRSITRATPLLTAAAGRVTARLADLADERSLAFAA